MLKIGELAKQSGITVRTLHHYDALGLVRPSRRTSKGYRLYTAEDVARLHMVRVLQELGTSLKQIKSMMQIKGFSYKKVIGMQLATLKEQISLKEQLHKRLTGLQKLMEQRSLVPLEDVLYLLQIMDNIKQFNLNPQDEERLKAQWGKYGQADIKAVESEWPKLIAEVRAHMQKGTDPKNETVQKLAKRWMELVNMFTAGIPQMAEVAKKNLEENHASLKIQHGDAIPDKDMMEYIQQALQ